MADRECWLVGGKLKNSHAAAPKELRQKRTPALFKPRNNPNQKLPSDITAQLG